jgi:hypothetical protein
MYVRTISRNKLGGHYPLGEKLRDDQEDYQEALSRRGRYQKVKDNLERMFTPDKRGIKGA